MKTILMMSSAAAVAAVAAMVWGAQPARSSQDWLAKAQSEFATKARDAVIQRQIGKASGGSPSAALVTESDSAELPVPVTADLAPELAPTVAQASIVPPASAPSADLPVASAHADVVTPSTRSEVVAFAEPAHEEAAVPTQTQPEAHDVVMSKPAEIVAPQPVAATTPQAVPETRVAAAPAEFATKHIASPSVADTQPRNAAPQKARRVARAAPASTDRRSTSDAAMRARGLEALRQHSPELAAMVSRYM